MSASDLFHAGKLKEAIAASLEEVRNHPTDSGRRLFLAELLCFAGDLERADNHLDALGHNDPQTMPWIVTFRQLIRAEQARQDFFAEGRLPEFLTRPEGAVQLLLEASIRVREGSPQEAARLLDEAEASRPQRVGDLRRPARSHDFRDLDDLTSCVLEVLTTKGTYYWIPIAQIESIEFHEPARPRDLLWRRTRLIVRDGPDGEVYVPVLYRGCGRRGRRSDPAGPADRLAWRGRRTRPGRGPADVPGRRRGPADPGAQER